MKACLTQYGRGTHGHKVELGHLKIWFSFKRPIAFQVGGGQLHIRQNDWGSTTRGHMACIDSGNKEGRVSGTRFEAALKAALDTWRV